MSEELVYIPNTDNSASAGGPTAPEEKPGAGDHVTVHPAPALIRIDAPEALFGADRYIMRRKRVKLLWIRQIEEANNFDAMYETLATVVPEWNLVDIETGVPLDQPKDSKFAFDQLDNDQAKWLTSTINPRRAG